jgi:hypothetical protein
MYLNILYLSHLQVTQSNTQQQNSSTHSPVSRTRLPHRQAALQGQKPTMLQESLITQAWIAKPEPLHSQ